MKKLALLLLSLTAAACSQTYRFPDAGADEAGYALAPFLRLKEEEQSFDLPEHLTGRRVDSVTSQDIILVPEQPGKRYRTTSASDVRPINRITVWQNGSPRCILAIRTTGTNDPDRVPFLSSTGFERGEILINVYRPATMIVALWQDRAIPDRQIVQDEEGVRIRIPENARDVGRSFIRVIACNGHGLSNDMLIPLQQGIPVMRTDELTDDDRQVQIDGTLRNNTDTSGLNRAMMLALGSPDGSMIPLAEALRTHLGAEGYHNTAVHRRDSGAAPERVPLLNALLLTIPGIPAPDPADLTEAAQRSLHKLTALRRGNLPLLYGDCFVLEESQHTLLFARIYMGDVVIVALNNSPQEQEITLQVENPMARRRMVPHFGGTINKTGNILSIKLPALGYEVFTRHLPA